MPKIAKKAKKPLILISFLAIFHAAVVRLESNLDRKLDQKIYSFLKKIARIQ